MIWQNQIMDIERLRSILTEVAEHARPIEAALAELRNFPYGDLEFARIDHHRELRTAVPEVVFGQGKTPEQIAAIVVHMVKEGERAIVTLASTEAVSAVEAVCADVRFFESARIISVGKFPTVPVDGPFVAVVSAGTSDIPFAEEAAVTAELLGTRVQRIYDVGVAGIHRLLDQRELLWEASTVIAVAGMEGALATVIGGMVASPVVALPTSVGYGASFEGLAALLAMLNSCAPGVAVVNIDNGFGAGVFAYQIINGNT